MSVSAYHSEAGLDNLKAPIVLDVLHSPWPIAQGSVDAVFCANMIHISPWACTGALLDGAGGVLKPGGHLVLYGPYRVDGRLDAPSNEAFDQSLKARNPSWGIRDLEEVTAIAEKNGLHREAIISMPANNLMLIFRRTTDV